MKLSENAEEVFYRSDMPNGFWYEFAYVKSRKRFLAFRCNAFAEDPDWQEMDASDMLQAEQGVFEWVSRN